MNTASHTSAATTPWKPGWLPALWSVQGSVLLGLVTLISCVGLLTGCGDEGGVTPFCSEDNDCLPGERCQSERCVLAEDVLDMLDVPGNCGTANCTVEEACCRPDSCVALLTGGPAGTDCGGCGIDCNSGESCNMGVCGCGTGGPCAAGEACCDGSCIDVLNNGDHCRQCDAACGRDQQCIGGNCVCPTADAVEVCTDNHACCPGIGCVPLSDDPMNCGGCGRACQVGEVCSNGSCQCGNGPACAEGQSCCGTPGQEQCVPPDDASCVCRGVLCEAGEKCCEDSLGNEACVSLASSAGACGACGSSCDVGELCRRGRCEPRCALHRTACGDSCVDIATDPAHCGACDMRCADDEVCSNGRCLEACVDGWVLCGTTCREVARDAAHCGACDAACGAGQVCLGGECGGTCPDGLDACAGACVNVSLDPDNCGGCGNVCGAEERCALGQCVDTCPPGTLSCGAACVDPLLPDTDHCAGCGARCLGDTVCSRGGCAVECSPDLFICGDVCTDTSRDPRFCGACDTSCNPGASCSSGQCGP